MARRTTSKREQAGVSMQEYLLTGPLEPTNRPYALAKIAGIEMLEC